MVQYPISQVIAQAGIDGSKTDFGMVLNPVAYKINMIGADFQTTVGKYGLRVNLHIL